jgi:hypothetical protein
VEGEPIRDPRFFLLKDVFVDRNFLWRLDEWEEVWEEVSEGAQECTPS